MSEREVDVFYSQGLLPLATPNPTAMAIGTRDCIRPMVVMVAIILQFVAFVRKQPFGLEFPLSR